MFGPLREFCEASDHADCVRWRFLIDEHFGDRADYAEVLMKLAAGSQAKSLRAQLSLSLAQFVEGKFFGLTLDAEHRGLKRMRFHAPDTMYRRSTELATFVNKTATVCEAMAPIKFLSITTDKSNVGGLPLQNSFMNANSGSFVFLAIAQVPMGLFRGSGHLRPSPAFLE